MRGGRCWGEAGEQGFVFCHQAYSPATEAQLLATEQELGFFLPPLLRSIYSQVANGGFGPGYGLIGAIGGFDEAGNIVDMYQYHTERAQCIDLQAYHPDWEVGERRDLPERSWPRSMLYLCDWGDAKVSCLDCATDRVFLVSMGEKQYIYVFELQALSLLQWFEQWLESEEEQTSSLQDDFGPLSEFDW